MFEVVLGVRPLIQPFLRLKARPDQVLSSEHTLKSTQPAASPVLRTILPSRSDFTPEAFFGQTSQRVCRAATLSIARRCACNSRALFAKHMNRSLLPSARAVNVTLAGSGLSVSANPFGEASSATLKPAFTPSFVTVGVPQARL